jgi:aryl-alcohol dehydrogenase-like predicted oxidoreductase
VGKWVRERGVRNHVIVTTKGGEDRRVKGLLAMRREQVLEDIEESLTRAGFDSFDFFLFHVDDVSVPMEEALETMEEIKRAGKIRYYGCSNWTVARQREANAYAKEHGLEGFRLDEVEMNLTRINRDNVTNVSKWLDEEFAAYHRETGTAVGAYSPMAAGVLAKLIRDGDTRGWNSTNLVWYDNPYNREVARRLKILSEETGHTVSQLQLAYVMAQPYGFPVFAIAGSSSVEQLEENLGAFDVDMTPEMISFLKPSE